jgi:hypothetical protein
MSSNEIGLKGDAMPSGHEEFWSALPEKVMHPVRVPMLEALWWIGEPLSAITTVDVLDGHVSMWEAAHHLQVLETLDVVEPVRPRAGQPTARSEVFEARYRLKAAAR